MKQITLWTLGLIAFITIIVLQPSEDSPTWISDFLVTKTIGFMALFAAVTIAKYNPTYKSNL